MKNLLVSFDEITGDVSYQGFHIGNIPQSIPAFQAAMTYKHKPEETTVASLVELKKAGYLTEDIVQLKREGIL